MRVANKHGSSYIYFKSLNNDKEGFKNINNINKYDQEKELLDYRTTKNIPRLQYLE